MKRTAFLLQALSRALAVTAAGTAGVQALITGAQIKDGTIQSRDIKNGSVARADIRRGAASLRGVRGPAGAGSGRGGRAAGAAGRAGARGPGSQGLRAQRGSRARRATREPVCTSPGPSPPRPTCRRRRAEGDAYIALDTGHLHVWDGDSFVDTGPVRGPEGRQGRQGRRRAGPAGPKGDQGSRARRGRRRARGLPGRDGRACRDHVGRRSTCPRQWLARPARSRSAAESTSATRPSRSTSRSRIPTADGSAGTSRFTTTTGSTTR